MKMEVNIEVPKAKKKRGRKPKIKKEKTEKRDPEERYVLGRPHGKRHTTCYGCDMTFSKATVSSYFKFFCWTILWCHWYPLFQTSVVSAHWF